MTKINSIYQNYKFLKQILFPKSMLGRYGKQVHLSMLSARFLKPPIAACKIRAVNSRKLPPIDNCNAFESAEELKRIFDDQSLPPNISLIHRSKSFGYDDIPFPSELNEDFIKIFQYKCDICLSAIEVKTNNLSNNEFFQAKTKALNDIYQILQNTEISEQFQVQHVDKLFAIVTANITRALKLDSNSYQNFDDQIMTPDPFFMHLNIVYQIYMLIIENRSWQKFYPPKFYRKVIFCSNSPDSRERDLVVQSLVHSYINLVNIRSDIMKDAFKTIYDYVCGYASPFCVNPMLNFLSRIFNASNKFPIECQTLCIENIIPLLQTYHLSWFIKSLRRVFTQMLQANNSISSIILKNLIVHWPICSQNKQPIFLSLIKDVLEVISEAEFNVYSNALFRIYRDCAMSLSSKVAEESFKVWQNKKFIALVKKSNIDLIESTFVPIKTTSKSHWCITTQDAAKNVVNVMNSIDQNACEIASYDTQNQSISLHKTHSSWIMIANTAASFYEVDLANLVNKIDKAFPIKKTVMFEQPLKIQMNSLPSLKPKSRLRRHSLFY
ncbi:hypothetical protein TRFO_19396 [Tritrichomonas foetus]|uniref:Phosphoprotein phosphatase n=1 Tax=Tritrichomonas foetus TaxID=1144522 RepID=A0A1J4KNC0_9EUKA|nr:hypothetical protein TRFO_19396 [Tritrichomonas foetus]|eukprot:OHT11284.1 hypothetical protein TRFO_19396 [Tritrichomonas foetus]